MKVRIDSYPLPEIDYYEGHFQPPGKIRPKKPIYACWRTASGQHIRPLDHKKDSLYTMDIPEDAVDGLLAFLFPVVEHFGPAQMTKKFPVDIKKWIGSIEDTDFPGKKHAKRMGARLDSLVSRERYFAYLFGQVKFPCYNCVIDCPNGAIEINDQGHCSINPYKCDGQKYSLNANASGRGEEEICWICFNPGDGTVSTKCNKVTIRKVLHMNPDAPRKEVPCCGGCDVDMVCPEGALTKVNSFYSADKSACTGCMICYNNHPYGYCPWNCGTYCYNNCNKWDMHEAVSMPDGEGGNYYKNIHGNYTMRMVSEIDYKGILLIRTLIVYRPWPILDQLAMSHRLYLAIWGDDYEEIPIKLDPQGTFSFNMLEIPFSKSIHLALLDDEKRLLDFQHCGLNLPIQSIGGKRYAQPRFRTQGGKLTFKTRLADFELSYLLQ